MVRWERADTAMETRPDAHAAHVPVCWKVGGASAPPGVDAV